MIFSFTAFPHIPLFSLFFRYDFWYPVLKYRCLPTARIYSGSDDVFHPSQPRSHETIVSHWKKAPPFFILPSSLCTGSHHSMHRRTHKYVFGNICAKCLIFLRFFIHPDITVQSKRKSVKLIFLAVFYQLKRCIADVQ